MLVPLLLKPSPKVAAAVLMAPPVEVTVAARAVAYELLYSLDPTLLPQLRRYGLWGILPAFRSFKRSEFPIRMAASQDRPHEDYLDVVQGYLEDSILPLLSSPQSKLDQLRQSVPPSLVITGAKDVIAPKAAAERYSSVLGGQSQSIALANHFTLPFKSQTISAILSMCQQVIPSTDSNICSTP